MGQVPASSRLVHLGIAGKTDPIKMGLLSRLLFGETTELRLQALGEIATVFSRRLSFLVPWVTSEGKSLP